MRPSPALLLAVAALGIATSSIFLDLSGTSPSTATFFRCAMAVPLLVPLAVREQRRGGAGRPLTRRQVAYAAVAGAFFAGDSLWWTQAIGELGAGLSTVLVNAQVVLVPLLALAVDREPISRRFVAALPVMLAGIVLTGGVFESGAGGADPVGGTVHALLAAACYSGFLFLLRRGGARGRWCATTWSWWSRPRWWRWRWVRSGAGSRCGRRWASWAGSCSSRWSVRWWGGCSSRSPRRGCAPRSGRRCCCSRPWARWRWPRSCSASGPAGCSCSAARWSSSAPTSPR